MHNIAIKSEQLKCIFVHIFS